MGVVKGHRLDSSEDVKGHRLDSSETVFYNGRIYTMNEDNPVAEAVTVSGDRILFVGSSDEALAAAGPDAVKYDLNGLTVIPGLVDAHAHFVGGHPELREMSHPRHCF